MNKPNTLEWRHQVAKLPLGGHRLRERPFALLALVVLSWLFAWQVLTHFDHTQLVFEVAISAGESLPGEVALYYDTGDGIRPANRVALPTRVGESALQFQLPLGGFRQFRLDLPANSPSVVIRSIKIRTQSHARSVQVPLDILRAAEQTAELRSVVGGLQVVPAAGSPRLQLQIEPQAPVAVVDPEGRSLILLVTAGLLVFFLFGLWYLLLSPIWSWRNGFILGGMIVFVLTWTMAWLSPSSGAVHPDEIAHVWAFQYYLDHLFPAAVDDPVLERSISVYGFSYLFEMDVVYALAARSTGAVSAWFSDDTYAARCFNLALLLGLVCLALRKQRYAVPLSVLLLSPQTWYVFSYFNGDAFALTLSLIAACLVADQDSGINKYLSGLEGLGIGVVLFALIVGLLLVSKRNYLPMVPVLGLWLVVRHLDLSWRTIALVLIGLMLIGSAVHLQALPSWTGSGRGPALALIGTALLIGAAIFVARKCLLSPDARPIFVRFAVVLALIVAAASPRVLIDLALNGLPGQKAATLEQIAETHAGHGFKPSQLDQDFAYYGRAVAQRDVSLWQVLYSPFHWVYFSYYSAYGVYGYFTAFTPYWMVLLLQGLTLAITLIACMGLVAWSRRKAGALLLLFAGGSVLVVANSLLHSWTFDVQTQGRYLFPIFAMLALLLGTAADKLPRKTLAVLIATAFLFSFASFVGTALPALAPLR